MLKRHDTIQIKCNYARIHYDIATKSHLMICKKCVKFQFGTNNSSIFVLHGKHSCGKVLNKVWYQTCDLMGFIQQTHIYILHQPHDVPSFARCRLTNDSQKTKRFFSFAIKMLLNLVAKIKFYTSLYIIIWALMAKSSWLKLIHV